MRTVALAAVLAVLVAAPASADWVKLDDFEGDLSNWTVTWYADPGKTTTSGIVDDPDLDPGNKVLWIDDPSAGSGTDAGHNLYLDLGDDNIADGATGTLFGRMRTGGPLAETDGHFGVSALAAPAAWGDFSAYMSNPGNAGWQVRDTVGTTSTYHTTDQQPDNQTWINFWIVVDNFNDKYHVYFTTTYGEDAEALSDNMTWGGADSTFAFRGGTGALDMQTLLVRASHTNADGWYLDDLYIDSSSQNLSNPLGAVPEPGTLLLLGTGLIGAFGYLRRRRMC